VNKHFLLKIVIAGLALYGLISVFGISRLHFNGCEDCPKIGPIPACYVVLLGYTAMLVSALKPMKLLFLIGWLPVFLLAASGVGAEILSDVPVCPQTEGGIPECYFSFALSVILGLLAVVYFAGKKNSIGKDLMD